MFSSHTSSFLSDDYRSHFNGLSKTVLEVSAEERKVIEGLREQLEEDVQNMRMEIEEIKA